MKKCALLLLCGMVTVGLLAGCGSVQTAGMEVENDLQTEEGQLKEPEQKDIDDQTEPEKEVEQSGEAEDSAEETVPAEQRQLKRVVEYCASIDDETGELEKDGNRLESLYEYDEQGKLIVVFLGVGGENYLYEYDEQGKMTVVHNFDHFDVINPQSWVENIDASIDYICKYDEQENLTYVKENVLGTEMEYEYEYEYQYDEKGNIAIQLVYCSIDGKASKVTQQTEYEYDEQGRKILERQYNNGEPWLEIVFDEQGNKIAECPQQYGTLRKYEYNDKGFLLKEYQYLGIDEERLGCTTTYEYEYDKYGNRTVRHEVEQMSESTSEAYYIYENEYY